MSIDTACISPAGDSSVGPVRLLTVGREPGPVLRLLDLGATVHRLEVSDRDGVRRNVVLGHPGPEDYLQSTAYLGATVGRYANRIAAGRFTLDGTEHQVGTNDRGNALHGGPDGFDSRLWEVRELDADHALLALVSPDGDQGYPGTLSVTARFEVAGDEVRLDLSAVTDAATLVNLTNHAYFNLDGGGPADQHLLSVAADHYTPVDDTGIPLAGHEDVTGTPFDLRQPAPVGRAARTAHPQVVTARGIDHNLVPGGQGLRPVATLSSPQSGLRMTLATDQPALQVYTGNFLDGSTRGVDGALLRQGEGVALEPQLPPDTPNHPEFGSAVLRPGETYRSSIRWRFDRA